MKKFLLALTAAAAVGGIFGANAVTSKGATLFSYSLPGAGWISNISDNGKWAVCVAPAGGDKTPYAYRIDLTTGKIDQLPLNAEQANPDHESSGITNDISDSGEIIAGSFDGYAAYYQNETWNKLEVPKTLRRGSGEVLSMTPDGSSMVGWIMTASMKWVPAYWKDNKWVEVTNLPTYDEMLELGIIDKSDYEAHKKNNETPNIQFNAISADGRYIAAATDHNYPAWGAGRFVYDTQTQTYDWLMHDIGEYKLGGINFVDDLIMSNNGRHMVGYATVNVNGEDISVPFTYNPETKEVVSLEGQAAPAKIDNEGNFYCTAGSAPLFNNYVVVDGLKITLDRILKQKYGIDFAAETGFDYTGCPAGISDDGRTIAFWSTPQGDAYSLNLPETLYEAARGVNVLTEWAPYPAQNADIARLKNMTISLSYSSEWDETKVPYLRKQGGDKVADAVSVTPYSSTKTIYTITFDSVKLEDGVKYEVVVPAGAFYVANTSFKTDELVISYVGREEAPLAATRIQPEPGSSMREFSSTNAVAIDYPTNIVVTPSTAAELYVKGASTAMTIVSLTADGKRLYLYPPAARMLNQGTDYVIKVPAGAVTDISGFCPNEAFELEYAGSYLPDPSDAGGSNLFFDDMNNPNQSLSNFLLFEGDHNAPSDDMAALGFDKDNTPWNFSVRDEDNYDYCAASMSMFKTQGTADDWMVIPQLSIVNEDCYLTFKGQSYLKNRNDVLKVIVYEDDERYGSLDANIVKNMKEKGTVVFSEQLKPGKTESIITDEWTEYEVNLGQFKDKKIYIAFVNENKDQSMLFVDDVKVAYRSDFLAGSMTDETAIAADEIEVKAFVRNNRADNFNNIEATLKDSEGKAIDTFTKSDIALAQNQNFEFTFSKKLPLVRGIENQFEIEIKLDDQFQNFKTSIKNLTEKIDRKALVEEGTGMWCANCPRGILAFEYMENQLPGRVIPVAIHNGDRYEWDDYLQFLGINAFPSGIVNRRSEIGSPMGDTGFTSSDGTTWMDMVLEDIANPAEVGINIKEAYYCLENSMLEVPFDVNYAINKNNMYYNVLAIFLEDGLKGRQNSNLYNLTEDIFGEWNATGKYGAEAAENQGYVVIPMDHVARGIAGTSFYGLSGLLPQAANGGETYSSGIQCDFPALVTDRNNMSVVLAIIDAGSGRVLNADVIHTVGEKEHSGINEITNDPSQLINFSAVNGTVLANGTTEGVEVYSLQGVRMANRNLKGFYIIRATRDGRTANIKMLIK